MSDYVNSLPNELLLAIFDRIPLTNLLRLDRVSLRWATLQPRACNRRRTLVLILGGQRLDEVDFTIPFNDHYRLSFETRPFYDLPSDERASSITLPNLSPQNVTFHDYLLIDDDDNEDGFFDILYRDPMMDGAEDEDTEMARFRCAYLSHELVAYFADQFPNVHNLVVIHPKCNAYDLRSLIGLVGSWPLVTLKLWTRFYGIDHQYEHRPDQHPVLGLLKAIKRQSALNHLTLNIGGEGGVVAFPAESYSFNAQPLKVLKLNIGNYADNDELWDTVHRLDSDILRYIGLANYFNSSLQTTVLNPQFGFTPKVRQLYWHFEFANAEQLNQLCARYCSLSLLRIEWASDRITFTELVSNLASLRQLTHLRICIDQMPENPFVLMMDRADDDGQEVRRISLPQVKNLELTIVKRSHQDFESLEAFVFPSVEAIILKDDESICTVCGLDGSILLGTGQCHRQLLLSLKNKFAVSLRRLYSTQGFAADWTEWSNYLPMQDEDFPEISDLTNAEDDDDEEDDDGDDEDDIDFDDDEEVEGEDIADDVEED